jgi:DNA-binding FrmR family transcriptional regulator
MMDDVTKKAVQQRLASAAGHLNGISRMVDGDQYCIDVIKQVQAVQAALSAINTLILDNHLHTCVTTAVRGDDPADRERVLEEITSVFAVTSKR